jgi:hypothetical protein
MSGSELTMVRDRPTLPAAPLQLVWRLEDKGVEFAVDAGDIIAAPADLLTADDLADLRCWKAHVLATLLARLAPVTEFVSLRGGLTVPRPALELALDLEARGFRLSLDGAKQIVVEPLEKLAPADLAAISRWRHHVAAIVDYRFDVLA